MNNRDEALIVLLSMAVPVAMGVLSLLCVSSARKRAGNPLAGTPQAYRYEIPDAVFIGMFLGGLLVVASYLVLSIIYGGVYLR